MKTPILMKPPMVAAALVGLKTQTRRLVKDLPLLGAPSAWCAAAKAQEPGWVHIVGDYRRFSPYGTAGDLLWVKETYRTSRSLDHVRPSWIGHGAPIQYEVDKCTNIHGYELGGMMDVGRLRQSIFMCQWMARLWLRVTDVRVERLHDITPADAIAEGIEPVVAGWQHTEPETFWKNYLYKGDPKRGEEITDFSHRVVGYSNPVRSYKSLWESINGLGSWASNPWVWVVTFRRDLDPNRN